MKSTLSRNAYIAVPASLLATMICSIGLLTNAQECGRSIKLNSGTVIPVKLDSELSSAQSYKGDTFTATVQDSSKSNYYGLPSGTQVEGVVRSVKPKDGKHPGMLDLSFTRLVLPDGHSYHLNGSLISLDGKHVTKDKNGRITAVKGHRTDRLTYVGYGAGAGLLVSLLTDKKNVLRDTGIGAGLGYLFGALEKDRSKVNDVTLKEGTSLGVRLDSSLSYSSAANSNSHVSAL